MGDTDALTILCVDDDESILDSLKSIVELEGHNAITAVNGQEALKAFQQHQDDVALVLTDIRMPVMDGLQLAREIRKLSDVPIVVISAYLSEDIETCDDVGINGFLTKPYGIQPVERVIKEYARRGANDS